MNHTRDEIAAIVARFFADRASGRKASIDDYLPITPAAADRDSLRTVALSAISDALLHAPPSSSNPRSSPSSQTPLDARPSDAELTELLPQLHGYLLIDCIGRGGMGAVYEAYQQSTGRRVAVKFLHSAMVASEAGRRRFEREVELTARLAHPAIASIIDSGVYRGQHFYVMEFIDGQPLDTYLKPGECDRDQALRLVASIGDAIDYAHQRGVLHRDLKPSNILIDHRGEPHILDFGLAKAIEPQSGHAARELTLSSPGQLLGTLAYMSPEQSRGRLDELSVRSDVYSLGVILYELLTGRLPCPIDGTLAEVLERIEHRDPPRPSTLRRGISADGDAILLKSLEKPPARRYSTAADLAADLRRLLAHRTILARPAGPATRTIRWVRRNRAVSGVAFVALLTLAATGTYSLVRIAGERNHALENEARARAQLAFALDALNEIVFDTNERLLGVLGADETRRQLQDVAIGFAERLRGDAAVLGLETQVGPQLGKLGDVFMERGELPRAREYYQRNHDIARRALAADPGNWERIRDLAFAQLRMSRIRANAHDAVIDLRAMLSALDRVAQLRPDDERAQHEPAYASLQLAFRLAELDGGEARLLALEGIDRQRRTLTAQPTSLRQHANMLELYAHASRTLETAGTVEDRLKLGRDAVDFAVSAAARFPREAVIRYEAIRASCRHAESLLAEGMLADASRVADAARADCEALLLLDPTRTPYIVGVVEAFRTSGNVALSMNDVEAAQRWYESAQTRMTPLFEMQPDNLAYRVTYSDLFARLGTVSQSRGRGSDAIENYREYLRLSEPLLQKSPESVAAWRANTWLQLGILLRPTDPAASNDACRAGIAELDQLTASKVNVTDSRAFRNALKARLNPAVAPSTSPASRPSQQSADER